MTFPTERRRRRRRSRQTAVPLRRFAPATALNVYGGARSRRNASGARHLTAAAAVLLLLAASAASAAAASVSPISVLPPAGPSPSVTATAAAAAARRPVSIVGRHSPPHPAFASVHRPAGHPRSSDAFSPPSVRSGWTNDCNRLPLAPSRGIFCPKNLAARTVGASRWGHGRNCAATSLSAVPVPMGDASLSFLRAASTLAISSSAGALADKTEILGGSSGTVLALAVSALLGNAGWAPPSHPLYDLCWTKVLPASLALILLSSSSSSKGEDSGRTAAGKEDDNGTREAAAATRDTVAAVSIPFLIGSLGSILGCVFSFVLCLVVPSPSPWMLRPVEASVAAGCLCASYIGGSVNFFATARIISEGWSDLGGGLEIGGAGAGVGLSSLLGSMAAADLLVMALYFASMMAAARSGVMRRWFPGREESGEADGDGEAGAADEVAVCDGDVEEESVQPLPGKAKASAPLEGGVSFSSRSRKAAAVLLASALAYTIVEASAAFERAVSPFIAGTGCAFIALYSTLVGALLRKRRPPLLPTWLPAELDAVAPPLSDACFYLLFAAVGASANVSEAVRGGPAALVFATAALAVHVGTVLVGTKALSTLVVGLSSRRRRFRFFRRIFPPSSEEVMVASNAAIGGPATAAAFAGKLLEARPPRAAGGGGAEEGKHQGDDGGKMERTRRSLQVAATVWGVVGYAVGTSVGAALTRALLGVVRSGSMAFETFHL